MAFNPTRWFANSRPTKARLESGRVEASANRALKVDPHTGLELVKMPWGQLLRRILRLPIYGTLSGGGPAYTFVEAEDLGGTWGAGATTGTAYEVNGVTGLAGKRDWLHPDRLGTYRFQWVAYAPPVPPCNVIVHLGSRNPDGSMGPGISGGTVTVTGLPAVPGPTTVTGTTDGSGNFTVPAFNTTDSPVLTVCHGGCCYTQPLDTTHCGETNTINLCFCSTVSTVSIAGPSGGGETLTMNGTVVHGGDVTPIGTASVSGSIWTFTYCNISLCTSATIPPTVLLVASDPPDWISACASFTPSCGTGGSITLTLYYWPTCYLWGATSTDCGSHAFPVCCDQTCTNPATPDHAGLYPKGMQIRWASSSGVLFASDESAWITLTLLSDVTACVGGSSLPVRTITWTSGCRSGEGNFISLPSGRLNNIATGDTSQVFFQSTSVTVKTICAPSAYAGFVGTFALYDRWQDNSCTPSPPSHETPFGSGVFLVNDTETDQGTHLGVLNGKTCAIVNNTTTYPYLGGSVTVDLREVSCTSGLISTIDTGVDGTGTG